MDTAIEYSTRAGGGEGGGGVDGKRVLLTIQHTCDLTSRRIPLMNPQHVREIYNIHTAHSASGTLGLPPDPLSLLPEIIRDGTFAFFKVI
jgi:hypothetical protein